MPKVRMITFDGRTQCLAAWAHELGITPATLFMRLKSKWPIEKALTTPKLDRGDFRTRRKRTIGSAAAVAEPCRAPASSHRTSADRLDRPKMTTAEADAFLLEYSEEMPLTDLAIAMGVSGSEVRRRCTALGIQWGDSEFSWDAPSVTPGYKPKKQPKGKRLPGLPLSAERIAELRRRASAGEELFGEADMLVKPRWGAWE
jgi:hypothetical protein